MSTGKPPLDADAQLVHLSLRRRRLAGHFESLLDSAIADPDQPTLEDAYVALYGEAES